MTKISSRASMLPESAIRKFVPFALDLEKKGCHVYKLNIGQPDIMTPKPFFDALKEFNEPVVEYQHSLGYKKLRETLSAYYKRHNLAVDVDDIIITAGGSEALIMAIAIVCNPGDEMIVPEPYYTNYNTFAMQNDVVLVPLPTRLEDNFSLKEIDKIEDFITPKTKAILLSNPCNPTGSVFTREELSKVAQAAKKHGLFIIADEVYRELVFDGRKAVSMLEFPQVLNQVILVESVSKKYSACGARIGWIVSKNKEVMSAALKFAQARLSVVTVEQYAIEKVIASGDQFVEEARLEYEKRRKYAYDKLTAAGIKCGYPAGALYMIADIGVNSEEFVKFMLSDYSGISKYKETTLVTPAATFYKTTGEGTTQIRLAFVLEEKKLEKAIHHLVEGLKEFNA